MILNNLEGMISSNRLKNTNKKLAKNLEKLASGYAINRAADNAAGLTISESMRALVTGLDQAFENVEDGISLIQVADGAMEEIQAMLRRGIELSVQSANGTYSDSQRKMMQNEMEQLKKEITRISNSTTFNGRKILLGNNPPIDTSVTIKGEMPSFIHPGSSVSAGYMDKVYTTTEKYKEGGAETEYTIRHSASILDFDAFTGSASQLADAIDKGFWFTCCTCESHYSIKFTDSTESKRETSGYHYIYNVGIQGVTSASELIDRIIDATEGQPNNHFTKLVKDGNKLIVYDDRSMDTLPNAGGTGNWEGWDYPSGNVSADANRGKFGQGIAVSKETGVGGEVVLQIGASSEETMKLDLPVASTTGIGVSGASVLTEALARIAIGVFERGIQYISAERGRMGAYQNRLEHTEHNLTNMSENTQASESRVRDIDMAKEMMKYTKNSILQQAGQTMLAQANQKSHLVLGLLR